MLDLGINVDELIDNAGVGIVTTEEIDEVKQMFFRALK